MSNLEIQKMCEILPESRLGDSEIRRKYTFNQFMRTFLPNTFREREKLIENTKNKIIGYKEKRKI